MNGVQEDSALMVRVAGGDKVAFDQIYARWNEPIWRFLMRRLGNRTRAEEAFQETWSRVWRYRERYDASRPFRPWLYTIAANLCRNVVTRAKPEDFVDDVSVFGGTTSTDRVSQRDELLFALESLDGADRTLILLTAEGFKPGEIAQMQGIKSGAVRTRLSRVRKRLSELLKIAVLLFFSLL